MHVAARIISMSLFLVISANAADINLPVSYSTLDNGLRLIMVPDTNVAVVSCRIYYFVGSMYESSGYTGLSHMFEHMMFKGTKRLGTTDYEKEIPYMETIDSLDRLAYNREQAVGRQDSLSKLYRQQITATLDKQRKYIKKDEIWELYQNNGGTGLNAWTADNMTAYIVTLPKNKVDLFYWIESDRMSDPVLREFPSERDVVMEERRMRIDNKPDGRYWERLNALFDIASPYRIPTIGWPSDIRGYTRQKLEQYVRRFYTPDNAVMILVGNIDTVTARKNVERYFGSIPRAQQPKEEPITREPAPIGETRYTVYDDAAPHIDMLFHTPGYPNPDLYRLDVIEGILSGRSGRLYRRLVDIEGLCISIDVSNELRLFDGCFQISADLKTGTDPAKVERIIREELARIASVPPTDAEMQRVRNDIRMSFVSDLKSLEGLSDRLAFFERLGSWRDMLTYPDSIAEVKPREIPPVAKKYLDPAFMTIGLLLPPPGVVPNRTGNFAPSTEQLR
ncbi:MAG: pitrilysin family protein [Chitinispirillaceae bacterium]